MKQYCENCGAEIRQGARFCARCGTPVKRDPAEEPVGRTPDSPLMPESPDPAGEPYTYDSPGPAGEPYAYDSPDPAGEPPVPGRRRISKGRLIALALAIGFLLGAGGGLVIWKLSNPYIKTAEAWTVRPIGDGRIQEKSGKQNYDSRGRVVPIDGGTAQKVEAGKARRAPIEGYTAEYDEDGRITAVYYDGKKLKEQADKEKSDSNGNLVRQVFADEEREITIENDYDRKRNVIKNEKEDGRDAKDGEDGTTREGYIKSAETWTYERPGSEDYSWSGKKTLEYDEMGRIVSMVEEEQTIERDEDGEDDEWNGKRTTKWEYDENGLLIRREVTGGLYDEAYAHAQNSVIREYRRQGDLMLLVSESRESAAGTGDMYPHRFKYDDKGVPVSETFAPYGDGEEVTYTFKKEGEGKDGLTLIGKPDRTYEDMGVEEIRVRLYDNNAVAERTCGEYGEAWDYYENGGLKRELYYAGDGVYLENRYTEDGRWKKGPDGLLYCDFEYDDQGVIKGFDPGNTSIDTYREESREKDENGNIRRQVFKSESSEEYESDSTTVTISYEWEKAGEDKSEESGQKQAASDKTEPTKKKQDKSEDSSSPPFAGDGQIDAVSPSAISTGASLEDFLLHFSQYHNRYFEDTGEWEREYDYQDVTGPEITIMANMFGLYAGAGPCIDYSLYPGTSPEIVENQGNDPENMVEKSELYSYYQEPIYGKYDKKQVDWILTNIFNVSEKDIQAMEEEGRKSGEFYAHECSYYKPYGNTVGDTAGGSPQIIKAVTDKDGGYCVQYRSESSAETYYAVLRAKTIDGKVYWSLYSHSTAPPEKLKTYF